MTKLSLSQLRKGAKVVIDTYRTTSPEFRPALMLEIRRFQYEIAMMKMRNSDPSELKELAWVDDWME